MSARKNSLAIARLAHQKSRQHEARAGYRFERAEIGTVIFRGLLETLQGVFKPDPRVLVPEVPASSQQVFRLAHGQPVTELRLACDPGAVFSQRVLDFVYSSRNGVLRNLNAPRLANHLPVIHQLPVIANQYFESAKGLWPQFQRDTVPKQASLGEVHTKRTERDLEASSAGFLRALRICIRGRYVA